MAKEILAQESYARGGIVAFAKGGQSQDWKSSLENVSQEMTAKDYKLHGWTDEDIADYKSSGRVPLDPQKQLALRAPEAEIPLPNEGESGAYNRYEEIQRNARRVPESQVINLGDDNARKPRAKTEARVEPIERGKGIDQFRPEASAERGPQRNLPRGSIEGEYVPASKATAGGSLGAPEQEPIDSRKMYSDETKKYKDAMEQRRADMAAGKKAPMNAGMEQEQLKARKKMGAEATVERPTGTTAETPTPKSTAWTGEEAPAGELGKNIKQGIKGAGEKIKGAGKTIGRALMSPELLVPAAQEYRAEQFKTGEGDALTKGLQGVQAGPAVALEALQRAVLGGSTADEFRKASPKLAAFIDETGKTVEDRFNAVKDYFTGEPSSAQEEADIARAAESTNPPTVNVAQGGGQGIPPPEQLGQTNPASPDVANPIYTQGRSNGIVPPAQPVVQQQGQGGAGAMQQAQPAVQVPVQEQPADQFIDQSKQPDSYWDKQVAESYDRAGLGANAEAAQARKEIMDERANASAESKRQTYLRMAEFFSHWGSTPGAPLAAGMRSLIETMPGYLEDKKEQKKLSNTLRESLSKLNEADRLEKMGMHREAMLLKKEASKDALDHKELMMKATEGKLNRESEERIAAANQGGAYSRAQLTAGRYNVEGKSDNVLVDNLQKQVAMDIKSLENLDESSIEYKTLVEDINNNREKLRILNKTTTAAPIPLTKEQSKKEWARQNNIG
jgi:hypothetical protein